MIPRTYPSTFAPNGQQQMVVYFLSSVTGLQRWVDYIPVRLTNGGVENSYDNNGYINVTIIQSLVGAQAWNQYIPVYLDVAATDVWQVNAVGYIPYNYSQSGDASLILDFTNGGALDSRITFTRASSGSYYNSGGYLQLASTNSPRFDYNPATLQPQGLLIEEARTNLLTYSSEFNDAVWVKGAVTVGGNITTSPDGALSAAAVVPSTVNTNHYVVRGVTRSTGSYTYSVYAKANGYGFIALQIKDLAGVFKWGQFNISTGVVVNNSGALSTAIQSVGNGWYRCIFTFDSGTGVGAPNDSIQIGSIAGNFGGGFAGDGVSGVLLWGAQLEAGAFATSYIPSTNTFVSRASTGTYYGSNGLIQTAAIDVARSNYNPANLTLQPTLLLEAAATNLLTYSSAFNQAIWNKYNTSLTSNAIVSPSGILEASLITDNSTPAVEHFLEEAISTYTNQTYTQSIYVKAATASSFQFVVVAVGSSSAVSNIQFDQSSGVYSPAFKTNGLITSATATNVGNGWYRCSVVYTLNGTVTAHSLRFYPFTLGIYAGTGVGHYIWGAQLEAGAFATSYIPTVAATVTRSADVSTSAAATRAQDNAVISTLTPWFNATEGTLLVTADTYTTTPAIPRITASLSSPPNGYVMLKVVRPSQLTGLTVVNDAGVVSADIVGAAGVVNTMTTIAGAYKANDFALGDRGGLYGPDLSGSLPTNFTALYIGSDGITTQQNGHIARLAYYKRRLSNAELQSITS